MKLSIQRNGKDFMTYEWVRGWTFCDYADETVFTIERELLSPSPHAIDNGRQIISSLGSADFALIEPPPLERPEPRPCYLPTFERNGNTAQYPYMPSKPTTIGITGHRKFDDPAVWHKQQGNVASWMVDIAKKYPAATIITGGAMGVDMVAAEKAIQNNLTSKVILPMHPSTFTSNWGKSNKKRLASILLSSDVEIIRNGNPWEGRYNPDTQKPAEFFASMPLREREKQPSFYDYSDYEYETLQERNQAIVDQSTILLAFWDGRKPSGTYNCLKYALTQSTDDITVINGITRETLLPETPIMNYFRIEEACIEGCEELQASIGYEKYATHYLSADYFSDNSNIFGIHDLISDPEVETGIAARVYASVSSKNPMIQKADAIAAAELIVKFGIESERYWTNLMKADFNKTIAELQHLCDALADCETPDTDALMVKGHIPALYKDADHAILTTAPENDTYDGVSASATYGFHRVDDEFNLEPATPILTRPPTPKEIKRNPTIANYRIDMTNNKIVKPDPRQQAKDELLIQIRDLFGKDLLTFGRKLYHKKAQYPSLNYTDWMEVWTAYDDRKKAINVISENGFLGTRRPHHDYPQVRRGKQLFAVQFPSGNWEFAHPEFDTAENRTILQLVIWDMLHTDWADKDKPRFVIKNADKIDHTIPTDDLPNIGKDGQAWYISEPELSAIRAYFRQDEKQVLATTPHKLVRFLNDNFSHNYVLHKNFDGAPRWVLEKAVGNIIIREPQPEPTQHPTQENIFENREFMTIPHELVEVFPPENITVVFDEKPIYQQLDHRTNTHNPIIISGHDDARQQARDFLLANGAKEITAPNSKENQLRFRLDYCRKEWRLTA